MKKIIKITGIIVCMAVLFLNISLNHKGNTVNIDLSKLIKANEADAECGPFFVAHGHCLADECYFHDSSTACSP